VLHRGRRPWITELVEQAKLRPEAQRDDGGFGIRNPRSRLPMALIHSFRTIKVQPECRNCR
jgi:hypothetical protein